MSQIEGSGQAGQAPGTPDEHVRQERAERTADVIVVGAGPGGAGTAAHLARRGLDVVLLEKATFPRDKICGDGLTPRAVRALVKLGVPGRDDLNALTDRVERLTAELRKSGAKAPAAAPARKAARKAAAKSPAKTARKAPAARKASKAPRKATKAAADNTATPPAAAD